MTEESGVRGSKGEVLRVSKDRYVVFDYALYAEDGDLVEDTEEEGEPVRVVYGYGALVLGLERGLLDLAPGETKTIVVEAAQAYGPHDTDLEHWVDRSEFPEGIEVDDEFQAEGEDGEQLTLRVVEVTDDAVLVDGNHPLAGERLTFDVIVREVRPGTLEEISRARAEAPRPRLLVVTPGAPGPSGQAPSHAHPSPDPPLTASRSGVRSRGRKEGRPPKASPRGKPPARDPLDDEQ
jgi:FKBP-type peptidyl-prolyl cis-trans isomerase SlyD